MTDHRKAERERASLLEVILNADDWRKTHKTKTQTYVVPLADVVERRAWTELRESIRRHFHEQLR